MISHATPSRTAPPLRVRGVLVRRCLRATALTNALANNASQRENWSGAGIFEAGIQGAIYGAGQRTQGNTPLSVDANGNASFMTAMQQQNPGAFAFDSAMNASYDNAAMPPSTIDATSLQSSVSNADVAQILSTIPSVNLSSDTSGGGIGLNGFGSMNGNDGGSSFTANSRIRYLDGGPAAAGASGIAQNTSTDNVNPAQAAFSSNWQTALDARAQQLMNLGYTVQQAPGGGYVNYDYQVQGDGSLLPYSEITYGQNGVFAAEHTVPPNAMLGDAQQVIVQGQRDSAPADTGTAGNGAYAAQIAQLITNPNANLDYLNPPNPAQPFSQNLNSDQQLQPTSWSGNGKLPAENYLNNSGALDVGANNVETQVAPTIAPFLYSVIPGGNLMLAAQGGHQLGVGIGELKNGNTTGGVIDLGMGTLQTVGAAASLRSASNVLSDTSGVNGHSAALVPEYLPGYNETDILAMPKGARPPAASDYLTQDYQDAHATLFENGAVRIQPSAPTGTIGRTETWVLPPSVADNAIAQAGGDVSLLEKLLGLDPGYLGNSP
eukprot:gene1842-2165_t